MQLEWHNRCNTVYRSIGFDVVFVATLAVVQQKLKQAGTKDRAQHSQLFFKTGPGEYAAGDKFLGCTVPSVRKIVRAHWKECTLAQLETLLQSPWHECRLAALYMLIEHFKRADTVGQKRIYNLYVRNTKYINNWDLVDTSAPHIVGQYLIDKPRTVLYTFAKSRDLWKKRIAILATFTFIRRHDFTDALHISELLVNDSHDLIHKAVGWMLREIGNKDMAAEERFLRQQYTTMPRTMLRYAIEKFPTSKKDFYMGR